MATTTASRASARDRLLAAADELFYAEGINTVGIDRVIERAGVAKASLYSTFGSKDELIRAYLAARHDGRKERITTALARYDDPRRRLLGLFDVVAEIQKAPGYRGCAFVNASAEASPESAAAAETARYRSWVRQLLVGLARDARAPDPRALAAQLVLLYDGAMLGAALDHDRRAAASARKAAEALLDAALASC